MSELEKCPFCGAHPELKCWPQHIWVYCKACEEKRVSVKAFGAGAYSKWCKENPDATQVDKHSTHDPAALQAVTDAWNTRDTSDLDAAKADAEKYRVLYMQERGDRIGANDQNEKHRALVEKWEASAQKWAEIARALADDMSQEYPFHSADYILSEKQEADNEA